MSATETAGLDAPGLGEDRPERPSATTTTPTGKRVAYVVVRHVSVWSVVKVAAVVYVCLWLAMLVAVAILWSTANSLGLVENVESFLQDVGFTGFEFVGRELFTATALGGLAVVVVGVVLTALFMALVNLVFQLVGGLRLTLADNEPRRKR